MSRSQIPRAPERPKNAPAQRKKRTSWLTIIAPLAFVALLAGLAGLDQPVGAEGEPAPSFELPTTTGDTISFDATGSGATLLYFSMGVGCDGCFAQIPEIEAELAEREIALLSVMVDPADVVAREADRFGISTPILIDSDRQVSQTYGMLGVYGHSDRPSHSFALVENGTITWSRHYAEMFVPSNDLFAELDAT
ncbi:MAG: redoxin domain-containing protein [Acidimicrobiia bacterium]|nr:redoxin domain-containing protein [Acidimicrobiia bacterium]